MCSVLQFPMLPMERKMSVLRRDDQFIVTRSVKEGEVRVKVKWEPFPHPQNRSRDRLCEAR